MLEGTTLGRYQIIEPLGAGGMGEVYRARDPGLERDVAIKLLPAELAADPDRLARLEREARALAALNHPNIATIHGLEQGASDEGSLRFLVLELIEGETLEERLRPGALEVEAALDIAAQVARGLEAAHEKGIVHRDLKPANVKITPKGLVKVLDFGLAKPTETAREDSGEETTRSPTVTVAGTQVGVILGTAAYMSPEQARGRRVDQRTDIWALGCMMYEMLTGRRPFVADDVQGTLAAVLEREPSWEALPSGLPPGLRRLLGLCLRKEPDERIHHIGDVRLLIDACRAPPEEGRVAGVGDAPRGWGRYVGLVGWGIAASLALFAALLVATGPAAEAPRPSPVRFVLDPGPMTGNLGTNGLFAVSPDGQAFVHTGPAGAPLRLRTLDELAPRELPGTEGGLNPFWSPDGSALGFTRDRSIYRMELDGAPRSVLELDDSEFFGPPSWGSDGSILYALAPPHGVAIYRVPAEGGTPAPVTDISSTPGRAFHTWPRYLPGGDAFLFVAAGEGSGELFLKRLATDAPQAVTSVESRALFVEPASLLYLQGGDLMSRPFDPAGPGWTGEPVRVAAAVDRFVGTGAAHFSASSRLLVTRHRSYFARLVWFDRDGNRLGNLGEPGDLWGPRISPGGDQVAVAVANPRTGREDVWIFELPGGIGRRLTLTDGVEEGRPVWSHDGSRVAFYSDAGGPPDVRVRNADGSGDEEGLVETPEATWPYDSSPDGGLILYGGFPDDDLWLLSVEDGEVHRYLQAPGVQANARFSPDGRWVAFESEELGSGEIFVAPLADADARRRISVDGGSDPIWSRDGGELFFARGGVILAVSVSRGEEPRFGTPRELFSLGPSRWVADFDVSPEGDRFLVAALDDEALRSTLTVQVDWMPGARE